MLCTDDTSDDDEADLAQGDPSTGEDKLLFMAVRQKRQADQPPEDAQRPSSDDEDESIIFLLVLLGYIRLLERSEYLVSYKKTFCNGY